MTTEKNDRPWFQVQASILDSIDLNRLSAEHERVFWRLNALCCKRGFGDTIRATTAEIAWALRMPEEVLRHALQELANPGTDGQGLVETGKNWVRITKWNDYQPASTGAERKKKARHEKNAADVPRGMPRDSRALEADKQKAEGREQKAEAEAYTGQRAGAREAGRDESRQAGQEAGKPKTEADRLLDLVTSNLNASDAKVADLLKDDPGLKLAVSKSGGWPKLTQALHVGGLKAHRAFIRSCGQAFHELAQSRRSRDGAHDSQQEHQRAP